MEMRAIRKKEIIRYGLLALVILLGLVRVTYLFAYEKKDVHSDEVWSYGLANSTDGPYIYENAETGEAKNCNVWTDGKVLHDYITVQEDERLAYADVYKNLSEDMHPPLYFWILHTICSLFPDQYSLWFGYGINMVSFVVMMLFLYRTMLLVTGKAGVALATVVYFELTTAVLNMMTFVRMYAMGMAIAAILIYEHACLYYKKDEVTGKRYVSIVIWTVLGALTHHFFLAWAFGLAAMFCLYYLIKKNWRRLFAYAGSMLTGALVSFAAFPAVFEHIFNEDTKDTVYAAHYLGLRFQFIMCLMITNLEHFGMKLVSPYDEGYRPYLVIGAGTVLVLFAAACIVFRNDAWYRDFLKKLKAVPGRIFRARGRLNWFLVAMFASVLFTCFVVANVVNLINMEFHTDRYLSTAYIAFVVAVAGFLHWILARLARRYKKTAIGIGIFVCSVFVICTNLFSQRAYLFEPAYDRRDIEQLGEGDNVMIVTREPWLLTVLAGRLSDVDAFYLTAYSDLYESRESMEALDSEKPMYLVLDTNWMDLSRTALDVPFKDENKSEFTEEGSEVVMQGDDSLLNALSNAGAYAARMEFAEKYTLEKVEEFITSLDNVSGMEYLGYDDVFGRSVLLYRLH